MKIKNKVGLVLLVLIISMSLAGCKGENEKNNEEIEGKVDQIAVDQVAEELVDGISVDNDIKAQAKKEGVSVKEMQNTLEGLAKLGADKYGISVEEYLANTKENGTTVLEEWQIASEYMEMSITEIYKYEKARTANMSEEDKATMAGMADALKQAGDIVIPEAGTTDVENMLGIHGNVTGDLREVSGNFKEVFYYKADSITQEYEDEHSIVVDYESNESFEKVIEYYISTLENTGGYLLLKPNGISQGMIQGTFNTCVTYVEVSSANEDGSGATIVSCYIDLSTKKEE